MSNACKNSLLVITAVIICVTTSLLGSKAFAESELYFPVNNNVSFVAPDMQSVFAVYEYETIVITKSTEFEIAVKSVEKEIRDLEIAVENIVISADADTTDTDEMPQATSTDLTVISMTENPAGYSELYFPVQSINKVSYAAPSVDEVFFTNQEYSTIATGQYNEWNKAAKRTFIAKEIADIERRIAVLQQQIVTLKRTPINEFGCGSCGSHVENLQKFLNKNGFTLTATGPGSEGQETKFFGPLTLKALQEFQSAYGIPASGRVDTSTIILINSIENGALGEITAESCVIQKIVRKDIAPEKKDFKNSQEDDKSKSGNFFIDLIKKIFKFLENLFLGS